MNLKIPELEMIRIIHPEHEFFGVAQEKAQSVFGFGNADLDIPKKTRASSVIEVKEVLYYLL